MVSYPESTAHPHSVQVFSIPFGLFWEMTVIQATGALSLLNYDSQRRHFQTKNL